MPFHYNAARVVEAAVPKRRSGLNRASTFAAGRADHRDADNLSVQQLTVKGIFCLLLKILANRQQQANERRLSVDASFFEQSRQMRSRRVHAYAKPLRSPL